MFRNILYSSPSSIGKPLKFSFFIVIILFFLRSFVYSLEPWTGLSSPKETKYKYFLHTGFIFEAVCRTAIFSYNLESPVIAETEHDVIYLDKIMIPKATKLIGYASVLKSGERVNVFFHTIVFPNGQEVSFSGIGLHTDGSAGIPGKIKKYREKLPAKVLLETAANVALPGAGGTIMKELTAETAKELQQYQPTYSITVSKDTPILLYNTQRIEY